MIFGNEVCSGLLPAAMSPTSVFLFKSESPRPEGVGAVPKTLETSGVCCDVLSDSLVVDFDANKLEDGFVGEESGRVCLGVKILTESGLD